MFYSSNIAQSVARLHKEVPKPTLHKRLTLHRTIQQKLPVTRSSPFMKINSDVTVNSHVHLLCCKQSQESFSKIITWLQLKPSSNYSVSFYLVLVTICSGLIDLFQLTCLLQFSILSEGEKNLLTFFNKVVCILNLC